MKVNNIHRRVYSATPEEVGGLIDTLSSENDLLWPHRLWPKMTFDKPLSVGEKGGHGPIRYYIEEYSPGKHIKFHFTGPKGFDGFHQYNVVEIEPNKTELVHTLKMNVTGAASFTWPLIFRPLHDALIEDSLSLAEYHLNFTPKIKRWPLWVRLLRWLITGGKAKSQEIAYQELQTKVKFWRN